MQGVLPTLWFDVPNQGGAGNFATDSVASCCVRTKVLESRIFPRENCQNRRVRATMLVNSFGFNNLGHTGQRGTSAAERPLKRSNIACPKTSIFPCSEAHRPQRGH